MSPIAAIAGANHVVRPEEHDGPGRAQSHFPAAPAVAAAGQRRHGAVVLTVAAVGAMLCLDDGAVGEDEISGAVHPERATGTPVGSELTGRCLLPLPEPPRAARRATVPADHRGLRERVLGESRRDGEIGVGQRGVVGDDDVARTLGDAGAEFHGGPGDDAQRRRFIRRRIGGAVVPDVALDDDGAADERERHAVAPDDAPHDEAVLRLQGERRGSGHGDPGRNADARESLRARERGRVRRLERRQGHGNGRAS